ncbi:RNA polymerase sigma factor 54, partial [Candidatus Magnetoovum chiemensis]
MALETRLETKLSQKLVLTPQLQQAIKLLQLPQLELSEAINQELIENPFLEENVEETAEEAVKEENPITEDKSNSNDDIEPPVDSFGNNSITVDEYFEERGSDGRDLGYFNPGIVSKPEFETFLSSSINLTEHLKWQVGLYNISENDREIIEMIIGNID